MPPFSRTGFALAMLLTAMAVGGCAARSTAVPTASVPEGGASTGDERPEPPTPGVKPLTVEQEEMIAQ